MITYFLSSRHLARAISVASKADQDLTIAIDAFLYSALALEAFPADLVEVISVGLRRQEDAVPENLKAIHSVLPDLENDKVQLRTKYKIIYYILTDSTLTRGDSLWQDFDFLIWLRNLIVHPKTEVIEEDMTPEELEKGETWKWKERTVARKVINGLRQRGLDTHADSDEMGLPWEIHFQSKRNAEWAVEAVKRIIQAIRNAVPQFPGSHVFGMIYDGVL